MTKNERIAELERKVAELEARPSIVQYPYVNVPSMWINYGQCPKCGGAFTMGHICNWWLLTTVTGSATDRLDYGNITVMGAAS